jgi:hypothetical protein
MKWKKIKFNCYWVDIVGEFKEAVEIYTNFITPPDYVLDENHIVLLIDVEDIFIEKLKVWSTTSKNSFNIYIYNHNMDQAEWLEKAVLISHAIIVNTVPTTLTSYKDKLIDLNGVWYYGPKRFLTNANLINSPEDYFINFENNIK